MTNEHMSSKEEQILTIENRIVSEYSKHNYKGLDWAKIAAHKIYAEMERMRQEEFNKGFSEGYQKGYEAADD